MLSATIPVKFSGTFIDPASMVKLVDARALEAPRRARLVARLLCPLLVLAAFWTGGALADGPDGLAAFKAGRYEEALDAFRREAEARPDSADAAANVGAALCRLGRYDEATRALGGALELGPAPRVEAAIRYDLGTAELGLNRVDDAIESLKASLRLEPGDAQAKANLEIALRRRREPPPPPPAGGPDAAGGQSGTPPPPSAGGPSPQPSRGMTREEAERLLDALGRRERLEFPRGARRPPSNPDARDW